MPPPEPALAPNSAEHHASPSTSRAAAKLRSCVVCRSRKVRCDKLSPCTNCRRANVACVVPSHDRPPRWARRLERIANDAAGAPTQDQQQQQRDAEPGVGLVMERLRSLEGLVRELSGQLAAGSSTGSSPREREGGRVEQAATGTGSTDMQKHFGRLVVQDADRSRYVSSGFWSRVSDELDGLKMDTQGLPDDSDTSDEEAPGQTPSSQELDRTPSARHAFMFGHNLGGALDINEFRPLPSQIPFLLDVYSENINFLSWVVHPPSVNVLVRQARKSGMSSLAPADEALLFSIFYSAAASMEEEDVKLNFNCAQADLILKYRIGLEHSLARSDFLNVPSLTLLQAFINFLLLARRHDSPRFVWMMVGLAIRMAQALGLHRDGANFANLSPFDVEMRRRAWWTLCMIDIRASEDQGTDFTIASASFDTKLPLNINNADIGPETTQMPVERRGLTDMSIPLAWFRMGELNREMMAPGAKDGGPSVDEQSRLLSGFYEKLEESYLQYATASTSSANWAFATATRLAMSKLTLFIYLPVLFSSPSEAIATEIKNKLLVAAIEVAEWNHALNTEQDGRQWRWVYQTYIHWHSIAYLLIETSRREWSPIVERAWTALHSSWLIPRQPNMDKNLRIWLPVRKMMAKARRHREAEIRRLRGDAAAVERLEREDGGIPVPASDGPFPPGRSEELFRQHWRQLVISPAESLQQPSTTPGTVTNPLIQALDQPPQETNQFHVYEHHDSSPKTFGSSHSQASNPASTPFTHPHNVQPSDPTQSSTTAADWQGQYGPGTAAWLWADTDPSVDVFAGVGVHMDVDVDSDVDWNNWLASATSMDSGSGSDGAGGNWHTPMQ